VKPSIKFHQNRPIFVEDITENTLASYFPDTLYYCTSKSAFLTMWKCAFVKHFNLHVATHLDVYDK